jgi:phage terminase large subunit-like protein
MSNPTKEVEALLLNENIVHGGNPVMRWMCSNVMIVADPAGNIKIAKDKSTEKVDGMVALVEAIGGWLGPNTGESVYNDLTKRPAGVRRL